MENEFWKDISGYETKFAVSNFGRIYQKEHRDSRGHFIKGKIRKTNTSSHDYESFSPDKGKSRLYVHRVVATAFCENPNGLKEVNHKDGNKRNNNANNLEWCTRLDNIRHSRIVLKVHPEDINKKKIFCVEEQKWYDSVIDFLSSKGICGNSVSGILDMPNRTIKGFHITSKKIEYKKENYTTQNKKWIKCLETNKLFLGTKIISEYLGVSIGSVKTALEKGTRCGGYHWAYLLNNKS